MMSGPKMKRLSSFTWQKSLPSRSSEVQSASKQDKQRNSWFSATKRQFIIARTNNFIVKRFQNNETWIHTFYFDIKTSRWWMMTKTGNWMQKRVWLSNELTILINLSPTQPIKRLFETTLASLFASLVSRVFYLNLLSHNREWIKLILALGFDVSLSFVLRTLNLQGAKLCKFACGFTLVINQ